MNSICTLGCFSLNVVKNSNCNAHCTYYTYKTKFLVNEKYNKNYEKISVKYITYNWNKRAKDKAHKSLMSHYLHEILIKDTWTYKVVEYVDLWNLQKVGGMFHSFFNPNSFLINIFAITRDNSFRGPPFYNKRFCFCRKCITSFFFFVLDQNSKMPWSISRHCWM